MSVLETSVAGRCLHAPWMEAFTETDYGTGLLRNRMLNELFAESVPVILHEDDPVTRYYMLTLCILLANFKFRCVYLAKTLPLNMVVPTILPPVIRSLGVGLIPMPRTKA